MQMLVIETKSNTQLFSWEVTLSLILWSFQLLHKEVLSHSDTITTNSAMAKHYVAQLELQDLQEHYNTVKDKAKV